MKNPVSDDQRNYDMDKVDELKKVRPELFEYYVMNDSNPTEFGGRVSIGSRWQHGEVPIFSRGRPVHRQFYRHYKPLYAIDYSLEIHEWMFQPERNKFVGFRFVRNKQ